MANDEKVQIEAEIDSSGVDAGIKRIVEGLAKLDTKVSEVSKGMKGFNASLDSAKNASETMVNASRNMATGMNSALKSMTSLHSESVALAASQKIASESFALAQRQMGTAVNQTEKLHKAYQSLRTDLTTMSGINKQMVSAFSDIGKSVEVLSKQLTGLRGAGKISTQEFNELNRSLKNITSGVNQGEKIGKQFDEIKKAMSSGVTELSRGISRQRGTFKDMWSNLLTGGAASDDVTKGITTTFDKIKGAMKTLTNSAISSNGLTGVAKTLDQEIGSLQKSSARMVKQLEVSGEQIGRKTTELLRKVATGSSGSSTGIIPIDQIAGTVKSRLSSGAFSLSQYLPRLPSAPNPVANLEQNARQEAEFAQRLKDANLNRYNTLKAIADSADAPAGMRLQATNAMRGGYSDWFSRDFADAVKDSIGKTDKAQREIEAEVKRAQAKSAAWLKGLNKLDPSRNVQGMFSPLNRPGDLKWSKEQLSNAFSKVGYGPELGGAYDIGAALGFSPEKIDASIKNSQRYLGEAKARAYKEFNSFFEGISGAVEGAAKSPKASLRAGVAASYFYDGVMQAMRDGVGGGGRAGGGGGGRLFGDNGAASRMVNNFGDGILSAFRSFGSGGKMAGIVSAASTIPQGIMEGIFKLNFHVFLAQQLARTLNDAFQFAIRGIDIEDQMSELSEKLSLPVESLNAIREAAVQTNTSMSDLQTITKNFTVSLDRINSKNVNQYAVAFENLGLSITDVKKKLAQGDTQSVFEDLLDKIGNADPSAALAGNVNKIFGRGGYKLIPIAKILAESRNDINRELFATGRFIDSTSAELGKKNQNLLLSLSKVPEGVREQITQGLDPGLLLALQKAKIQILSFDIGGGYLKNTVGAEIGNFFNVAVDYFVDASNKFKATMKSAGFGTAMLEFISDQSQMIGKGLTTFFGKGLPVALQAITTGMAGAFTGIRAALKDNLTVVQAELFGGLTGAKIGAAFGNPFAGAAIGAGAALVDKLGLDGAVNVIQSQIAELNNALSSISLNIDISSIASVGTHIAGIFGGVGSVAGAALKSGIKNSFSGEGIASILNGVIGTGIGGVGYAAIGAAGIAFASRFMSSIKAALNSNVNVVGPEVVGKILGNAAEETSRMRAIGYNLSTTLVAGVISGLVGIAITEFIFPMAQEVSKAHANGEDLASAIRDGFYTTLSEHPLGAGAAGAVATLLLGGGIPVAALVALGVATTSTVLGAEREAMKQEMARTRNEAKKELADTEHQITLVGGALTGPLDLRAPGPPVKSVEDEAKARAAREIEIDKQTEAYRIQALEETLSRGSDSELAQRDIISRQKLEFEVQLLQKEQGQKLEELRKQSAALRQAEDQVAATEFSAPGVKDEALRNLAIVKATIATTVAEMGKQGTEIESLTATLEGHKLASAISTEIDSISNALEFSKISGNLPTIKLGGDPFEDIKQYFGPENFSKAIDEIKKGFDQAGDVVLQPEVQIQIKAKIDREQLLASLKDSVDQATKLATEAQQTSDASGVFQGAFYGQGKSYSQAQREAQDALEVAKETKKALDAKNQAERDAGGAPIDEGAGERARIATKAYNDLTESIKGAQAARHASEDIQAAATIDQETRAIEERTQAQRDFTQGLIDEQQLRERLAGAGEDNPDIKAARERQAVAQYRNELASLDAEIAERGRRISMQAENLLGATQYSVGAYRDEGGDTGGVSDRNLAAMKENLATYIEVKEAIAKYGSAKYNMFSGSESEVKEAERFSALLEKVQADAIGLAQAIKDSRDSGSIFQNAFYGDGKTYNEAKREADNFLAVEASVKDKVDEISRLKTQSSALEQAGDSTGVARTEAKIEQLQSLVDHTKELVRTEQEQLHIEQLKNETAQEVQAGRDLTAELNIQLQFNDGLLTELEYRMEIAKLRYPDNPEAANIAAANEKIRYGLEQSKKGMLDLGELVRSSIEQIFDSVIDGSTKFTDVVKNIGKQWGRQIFSATLESKLGFDNKVKTNFLDLGSFGKNVFGGLFKYVFGTNASSGGSSGGGLAGQAINAITGGSSLGGGGSAGGTGSSFWEVASGRGSGILNSIFGQGAGAGSILPLLLSSVGGALNSNAYGTDPIFGIGASLGVQGALTGAALASGPNVFSLAALYNSPFTSLLTNSAGGIGSAFLPAGTITGGAANISLAPEVASQAIGSAVGVDGAPSLLLSDGTTIATGEAGGVAGGGMGPAGSYAGSVLSGLLTLVASYLGQTGGRLGAKALVGGPQSLQEAVSGQMGGTIGAAAGAIGGAIAGSVVPIIGTAIGAAIGALAGGAAGSAGGAIGAASRMRNPGAGYLNKGAAYGYGISDSLLNLPNDVLALLPATLSKLTGIDFDMLNWMINPVGALGTIMLKPLNNILAQAFRPPTHGTILRRTGESALDSLPTFKELQSQIGDISRSSYRGDTVNINRAKYGEERTVGVPALVLNKKTGKWETGAKQVGTGIMEGGLTEEGLTAIKGFATLFSGTMFSSGKIDSQRLKGNEISTQAAGFTNILTDFFGRLNGSPTENKTAVLQNLKSAMADMGLDVRKTFDQMNMTAKNYFTFLDDKSTKFGGGEDGMFGSATGIKSFGESVRGISKILESDLPAGVHIASIAMRSLEKDGVGVFDNMTASQKDFTIQMAKNPEQFDAWMGKMAQGGAQFDSKKIEERVKDISASSQAIGDSINEIFSSDNIDAGLGAFGKKMKNTLVAQFQAVSVKQLFDNTAIGESYEGAFKLLRQAGEGAFDLTKTAGIEEFGRRLVGAIKEGRMALAEYAPQLAAIRKAAADAMKITTEEDFNAEVAARTVAIEDNLRNSIGNAIKSGIEAGGGDKGLDAFSKTFRGSIQGGVTDSILTAFTKGASLNSTLAPMQAKLEVMIQQAFQNGVVSPEMVEKIKALGLELGKAINVQVAQIAPLAKQVFSLVLEGSDEKKGRINVINEGIKTVFGSAIVDFSKAIASNFDNKGKDGYEKINQNQSFVDTLYGGVRESMLQSIIGSFTQGAIIQGTLAPALDAFGQHSKEFFKDGSLSDSERTTLKADLSMVRQVLGETFEFLKPMLKDLGLTIDDINEITKPPKQDDKGKVKYVDGDLKRLPPEASMPSKEYTAWTGLSDEQRGFAAQIMSEKDLSYKQAIDDINTFSLSLKTVGYDVDIALRGVADSAKEQGISFSEARDKFYANQNSLYQYSEFGKIRGVTAAEVAAKGGNTQNIAVKLAQSDKRYVVGDQDADRANRLYATMTKFGVSFDEAGTRINEIMKEKGLSMSAATDYFITSMLSGGEEARLAARRDTETQAAIDTANTAARNETEQQRIQIMEKYNNTGVNDLHAYETANKEWIDASRARGVDEITIRQQQQQLLQDSGGNLKDATNSLVQSTTRLQNGTDLASAGLHDAGGTADEATSGLAGLESAALRAARALSDIQIKVNVDINGITSVLSTPGGQNTTPISSGGVARSPFGGGGGGGGRGTSALAMGGKVASNGAAVVGEAGKPELVEALPGGGFAVTPLGWDQAASLMRDGTGGFANGGSCGKGGCRGPRGCAGGCRKGVPGFASGGCIGDDCGNGEIRGVPGLRFGSPSASIQPMNAREKMNGRDAEDALPIGNPTRGVRRGKYASCADKVEFEKLEGYKCCAAGSNLDGTTKCMNKLTWGNTSGCVGSACAAGGGLKYTDGWKLHKEASCAKVNDSQQCIGADPNPFVANNSKSGLNGRYWVKVKRPFSGSFLEDDPDKLAAADEPAQFASIVAGAFQKAASDAFGLSPGGYTSIAERAKAKEKTKGAAHGGYIDPLSSAVVGEAGMPELVQALPGGGFRVQPLSWDQADRMLQGGLPGFENGTSSHGTGSSTFGGLFTSTAGAASFGAKIAEEIGNGFRNTLAGAIQKSFEASATVKAAEKEIDKLMEAVEKASAAYLSEDTPDLEKARAAIDGALADAEAQFKEIEDQAKLLAPLLEKLALKKALDVKLDIGSGITEFLKGGTGAELAKFFNQTVYDSVLTGMVNAMLVSGPLKDAMDLINQAMSDTMKGVMDGTIDEEEANRRLQNIANSGGAVIRQKLEVLKPFVTTLGTSLGVGVASGAELAKDAIRDAVTSAMSEQDGMKNLAKNTKTSIYHSIRDGMINAFLEAAVVNGALGPILEKIKKSFADVGKEVEINGQKTIMTLAMASEIAKHGAEDARKIIESPEFIKSVQDMVDAGKDIAKALGVSAYDTSTAAEDLTAATDSLNDSVNSSCAGQCDVEKKLYVANLGLGQLTNIGRQGTMSSEVYMPREYSNGSSSANVATERAARVQKYEDIWITPDDYETKYPDRVMPPCNVVDSDGRCLIKIPKFGEGGKISKPTLIMAGERGTEYIFNEKQMAGLGSGDPELKQLLKDIADKLDSQEISINLMMDNIKVGEAVRKADRIGRKTGRSITDN